MDGKFSVGYRDAVVRTVVGLDRETTASYTLILEAIGTHQASCTPPQRCSGQSSHEAPSQGPAGPDPRGQALSQRLCPNASGERATR